MTSAQPSSPFLRFLLPSVRDIIFLFLFWSILAGPLSNRPLADPDIGWHIRTGELILANHALVRTDPFSSTMQGRPWFAWEWLYDIVLGVLNRLCGLNGVVWFCAALVATVFAVLLWQLVRRGTGLPLALVLMLLAEATSTLHLYARPHIVSWLFSLLWFIALDRWETLDPDNPTGHERESSIANVGVDRGLKRYLTWFFPLSVLFWVNLHGGWIFGMALLGIYALAALVESWRLADPVAAIRAAHRARTMSTVWAVSSLATLVNPYGWRLHLHIYHYLTDRYLMNRIDEFRSPDFHGWAERCFAVILFLLLIALVGKPSRLRISHWLVVMLAVYSGFYSSRNLPVSSMLLVLVTGPILWNNVVSVVEKPGAWPWLARLAGWISNFSDRMDRQEMDLSGHLWPIAAVVLAFVICLQGGWLGARHLINARFDREKVPAAAVTFLQEEGKGKLDLPPLFSTDAWGGYLIYRLYPTRKVVVDDRHDLYGEARIRDYLILMQAEPGWREVLKQWQIRTALLPARSTLANLLRELPQDWRVSYEDKVAVVFERR